MISVRVELRVYSVSAMNIVGFWWEGWRIWLQLLCKPADWKLNIWGNCKHEKHVHSALHRATKFRQWEKYAFGFTNCSLTPLLLTPLNLEPNTYLHGAELRETSLLHLYTTKASHCTDGLQPLHFSACVHISTHSPSFSAFLPYRPLCPCQDIGHP